MNDWHPAADRQAAESVRVGPFEVRSRDRADVPALDGMVAAAR